MTPDQLLRLTIRPTLAWLADLGVKSDRRAEVMLLSIAGQESGYRYRAQVGGPARGLWQFERGGGVAGVLGHPATKRIAASVCDALLVPAAATAVHPALEQNDVLACAFARLLLVSDPQPLPTTEGAGWLTYLKNWRPGKPHPEAWPKWWAEANRVSV